MIIFILFSQPPGVGHKFQVAILSSVMQPSLPAYHSTMDVTGVTPEQTSVIIQGLEFRKAGCVPETGNVPISMLVGLLRFVEKSRRADS